MDIAEKVRKLPIPGAKRRPQGMRRRRDMDLFEDMQSLFENMLGTYTGGWPEMQAGIPKVDVIDRDNEILVRAEVPGVKKDDIDVTMTDDLVTIRGSTQQEEKREEGDYYYRETSRGEFSRSISLPAHVDGSKAKAKYTDGVLELTLPKVQGSKRHKIDITAQ
ncbi:MAG: Hsp20/alpha crystallin family protein [Thiogranum sp.]|nr:Hsp20/alpha crystallin family protein [Thiogranum sp.]